MEWEWIPGFSEVEEIAKKGKRIVFQGVEGAYSHAAAKAYFGEDADLYHVPEFEDTMKEVEEGRADYAGTPDRKFHGRFRDQQL